MVKSHHYFYLAKTEMNVIFEKNEWDMDKAKQFCKELEVTPTELVDDVLFIIAKITEAEDKLYHLLELGDGVSMTIEEDEALKIFIPKKLPEEIKEDLECDRIIEDLSL